MCCVPHSVIILRQAGTWDPLLQCLHLHLDKHLLEQQNTKKLQGTKNHCIHAQLGQIMNKIQKGHKPTAISEVPGAKAGSPAGSLHTAPPRGWTDHLSLPSIQPTHQPPPSPHLRNQPLLLGERAKGTCYLFSLHRAAQAPVKLCLNSLSGLLIFIDWRAQGPWSVTISRGTWYLFVALQIMPAWITCWRWYLLGFPTYFKINKYFVRHTLRLCKYTVSHETSTY